ncbi:hypothetical protein AAVH_31997 [Aphelenchoides avenae]|nr:hypothetical protein AAVH_31997 [Aphelenchus avenae]
MRHVLRNCHVRRLRIDDSQGESIMKLAEFTEEEQCHVAELEINRIADVLNAADCDNVWHVVTALSPGRLHCAFIEVARRHKCLSTPDFMKAHYVVVGGKFQAQTGVGSFEHPLFLQFPYRPLCRSSEAGCIEHHLGPKSQISVDGIDLRNIARFYPNSTTTFDYHVMRAGDKYKAFVLENASGQRVFVVASDDQASMMDGMFWLQRVAFVPDLTILRN